MINAEKNISLNFKENSIDKSYDEAFGLVCKNIEIKIDECRFIYFIDENYVVDTRKGMRLGNLTADYSKVLSNGLKEMKYPDGEITNKFCTSYNLVIDDLVLLCDRIISELDDNHKKAWFENLKTRPAQGFEEAIQRMLFVNQIMWQTDHRLVGLGAWDSHLIEYYRNDLENGVLNREEALEILKDLYIILHENYEYKSNVLMGDTGQVFVLGKSDLNGGYECNELTYLFIEAMMAVQQSEPKCVLRVNKNTPRDLIELSLRSIATGIGAPLFANDDVIIPQLIEFGIDKNDACDYTTSACWEPLIGGKSASPNNMTTLNYLRALDNLLKRERLENIHTFDELVDKYIEYLKRNLNAVKRVLENRMYQYDPLMSVFIDDCYENKADVSCGGSRYHNAGITSVAMGNLINSLANIKEFVFDKKEYTLYDVKQIVILNFEGNEELCEKLKKKSSRYATDNEEVIALVNRITGCVSEEIKSYRHYLGGKLKVGLSGSSYRDAAKDFGASFDGRKEGEPFNVHISNEDNNSFTEVINFASQIKYDKNRFNGNVVDLMLSPDFINNNFDKFVDFLVMCIDAGFFEMQMNVVSSKTLIEACENPEKFPNLIVRVWGFSAYFKDLPDDYKDLLIKRALKNETVR